MDNKKSYVYKITCKINGEFYFGSSFNAKSDYYWGTGRKIKERISQYGKENFTKEILGEYNDRVEALKKENEYIEQFRHDDKCLNQIFNRHFGTYSDETCAKRSAANRGKRFSEERRKKISAAIRGKKSNFFGKHHTEETRAKISVAKRGKKSSFYGKHWRKNPITGKREWYD